MTSCLKCLTQITESIKYGLHEKCYIEWFKIENATYEFKSLKQQSSQNLDPNQSTSLNNTSFYHGKFKKYSADLGSENYILKMRDDRNAPELPEVEYLCNQIADQLGIPIPQYYYIDFMSDKVFVTKVFIKRAGGTVNLEHIHKYRKNEDHNCEKLIEVIKQTTNLPYDVEVFLNTILFDALIGNHDRHGRNLAFIVTPSKTTLSPIYDNVSYLSLESNDMLGADFNPTGRIATHKTTEPSMSDYVEELIRLDYKDTVEKFLHKTKMNKIESLIQKSFCSDKMKNAIRSLINKRYKELSDGLQI